jgi:MFS family permease
MAGVAYALLPCGAYALSLALQSNLAVELGLADVQIAVLNLWSTVIFAVACIAGGWLSDRFGRRRVLALFVSLTVVPTLWLAGTMQEAQWIMPVDVTAADRPQPAAALVAAFWIAVLVFSAFQGLFYGVHTALFMDVTTPAVAATQFTAYMALTNLAITYSAWWQGLSIERWGYPVTLALDAAFGLLSLALLPLMKPARRDVQPAQAPGRAEA